MVAASEQHLLAARRRIGSSGRTTSFASECATCVHQERSAGDGTTGTLAAVAPAAGAASGAGLARRGARHPEREESPRNRDRRRLYFAIRKAMAVKPPPKRLALSAITGLKLADIVRQVIVAFGRRARLREESSVRATRGWPAASRRLGARGEGGLPVSSRRRCRARQGVRRRVPARWASA